MTTHDLKITHGRVVLPQSIETADILIDDGFISAVLKPGLSKNEYADQVIDATNYLVLPGLVDVHVHFRDPGFPDKEDFASGSAAAAAGGVTTIADMPNTQPPTNSPQRLIEKIRRAEAHCRIDFAFHGGPPLSDKGKAISVAARKDQEPVNVVAARQMVEKGIISFKIYMPHGEGPSIPFLAPLGLPLTIHAEDPTLLSHPKDGTSFAFLQSRPPDAEVIAIEHLMVHPPDGPIHICHVSTAAGLHHISQAQERGVDVTCEVTPHHLLLTVKDLSEIGPVAKCYPPLRSASDTKSLIIAVMAGGVDCIASDHAPHTTEEKTGPGADFYTAPGGIPGVETALPLLHTQLVKKAKMPLTHLIRLMATQPAQRFGIKNSQLVEKGQIIVGADADLVLFDPKAKFQIRGDSLHGKSSFTPFEGWNVIGKVRRTFLRGNTIYEENE